ncbi:MAG: protein kinase domain-containing protein [Gemmatimonadales bacterium]
MPAPEEDLDALKTRVPGVTGTPPPSADDELDALQTRVEREVGAPQRSAQAGRELSGGEPSPDQLPPGFMLDGKLLVIRKIGGGAMGVVYEALDVRTQARCAIKLLQPQWAARAEALAALRQEVAAAQSVTHQNLLRVNYFADEGPYKYLVMEYLDGADLGTHLARRGGKLPVEDGLAVLRQVAAGLDYLHDKGLVHQDLKPQNVFVTAAGEVRVLDYGIAKVVRAHGAQGAQASGGTLAYMAPEQVRGEAVDRRTDVYAFGLLCVEVLTGTLPFDVRDAKAVLAWHLDAGHMIPSLPEGAPAPGIAQCLTVDPKRRPMSCVTVVEARQRDVELTAPKRAAPSRDPGGNARNKWKAAGASVVVLIAVVAWWSSERSAKPTSPPRTPADSASTVAAPSPVSPVDNIDSILAHVSHANGALSHQCDANDLNACVALADVYARGVGVKPDTGRAQSLFRRACDGGDGDGCAGLMPQAGAALGSLQELCDKGIMRACSGVGNAYRDGHGVPKNDTLAERYLMQACKGGWLPACHNYASMLIDSSAAFKDKRPAIERRAIEVYQQLCERGYMPSCVIRDVEAQYNEHNDSLAFALSRKTCAAGYAAGCLLLGVKYHEGTGVQRNDARAAQLFQYACRTGAPDAGGASGCMALGTAYYNGAGVPEDKIEAVSLFRQSCAAGEGQACGFLAKLGLAQK